MDNTNICFKKPTKLFYFQLVEKDTYFLQSFIRDCNEYITKHCTYNVEQHIISINTNLFVEEDNSDSSITILNVNGHYSYISKGDYVIFNPLTFEIEVCTEEHFKLLYTKNKR